MINSLFSEDTSIKIKFWEFPLLLPIRPERSATLVKLFIKIIFIAVEDAPYGDVAVDDKAEPPKKKRKSSAGTPVKGSTTNNENNLLSTCSNHELVKVKGLVQK